MKDNDRILIDYTQKRKNNFTMGDIVDNVVKLSVKRITYYFVAIFLAGLIYGGLTFFILMRNG